MAVSFIQMTDVAGKLISVEKGQAASVVGAQPAAKTYVVNDTHFEAGGKLVVSPATFTVDGPTLRAAVGAGSSGSSLPKLALFGGAAVLAWWLLLRKR